MNTAAWFLLALPLAIAVFAVGLVFGLGGLDRERWPRVALAFAAIGGLLMGAGILLGDALAGALGSLALYVAAGALLVIGVRSLHHGLKGDAADRAAASPTTRAIATTGLVIAVDKLAVGLSFAVLGAPAGPVALIVAAQAGAASLLGLSLGARLGSKADEWAEIIAGAVFVPLGLLVLAQAIGGKGGA